MGYSKRRVSRKMPSEGSVKMSTQHTQWITLRMKNYFISTALFIVHSDTCWMYSGLLMVSLMISLDHAVLATYSTFFFSFLHQWLLMICPMMLQCMSSRSHLDFWTKNGFLAWVTKWLTKCQMSVSAISCSLTEIMCHDSCNCVCSGISGMTW